jgi:hypothetical protein
MMRKRNGSRRWVWRESEDEDDDWGCGETKKSKSRTTEKEESPSIEEDFLAMKSSSNPLWMKWTSWICDGQRVEEEPSLFLLAAFSCSGLFLVVKTAVADWLSVSNVSEGGGNVYLDILPLVYW